MVNGLEYIYNIIMIYIFLFNNLIHAAALVIGFNPSDYTFNEGETGELLVELSVPADIVITVTLSTLDDSARGWLCVNIISKL